MATSVPVSTANAAFAAVPTAPANVPFGGLPVADNSRITDTSGLTLMNGMTAGYGVNDGNTENPPAYPGTYGQHPNYMGQNWEPARIGVMRNIPGSLSNGPFSLYFIFNPNQIAVAFQVNMSQAPPLYLYSQDSAANQSAISGSTGDGGNLSGLSSNVPNLTNGQTVGWSLYFDRTYDLLYDPQPDHNRGVLKDVAALYNLMGTFPPGGGAGVPVSTPVQVVFGQTGSGKLWGFTGYISSVNITYGVFRHNMIPSRCEVDLQMQCTFVSSSTPPANASGGVASATTSILTGVSSSLQGVINAGAAASVSGPPLVKTND